jgi:hypothetical protein
MQLRFANCLDLSSMRDRSLRDCIRSCRSVVTRLRLHDPFQTDETQQVEQTPGDTSEHDSRFSKCSNPFLAFCMALHLTRTCVQYSKCADK